MAKWEYHKAHNLSVEQMNKLGLEEWELVSDHMTGASTSYTFKRKIKKKVISKKRKLPKTLPRDN